MEIVLQGVDMLVQIVTHKMVMAKTEAMTGTVVHVELLIGMEEVEWQQETKEGIIGVGLVHMTAQAGVLVHLHLTVTDCYIW